MGVRDLMDVTQLGESRRASHPFGPLRTLSIPLRRRRGRTSQAGRASAWAAWARSTLARTRRGRRGGIAGGA